MLSVKWRLMIPPNSIRKQPTGITIQVARSVAKSGGISSLVEETSCAFLSPLQHEQEPGERFEHYTEFWQRGTQR